MIIGLKVNVHCFPLQRQALWNLIYAVTLGISNKKKKHIFQFAYHPLSREDCAFDPTRIWRSRRWLYFWSGTACTPLGVERLKQNSCLPVQKQLLNKFQYVEVVSLILCISWVLLVYPNFAPSSRIIWLPNIISGFQGLSFITNMISSPYVRPSTTYQTYTLADDHSRQS